MPSQRGLPDNTEPGLKEGLSRQIRPAQGVIILAGMYAAYSDWIEYEILEARRMGKVVIGVKPWGQQRTPVRVRRAANRMVGWKRSSLIRAVRQLI